MASTRKPKSAATGKKATSAKEASKRQASPRHLGPVTLTRARSLVKAAITPPPEKTKPPAAAKPTVANLGAERRRLEIQRRKEVKQLVREYKGVMTIMKTRGVTSPGRKAVPGGRPKTMARGAAAEGFQPLQIVAEGDSWFDYPALFFGGGIIPRLEEKLGVPILNLAKAGDEVRFMLGVEERQILGEQLRNGCPAGGPWDVLLFSGGGNDIVDNPMALWVKDFDPQIAPEDHIHPARFSAALSLVRAGYEDLIALRDSLSPQTHLVFHGYDFAIPDGRGVCHYGPWLAPTFQLRGFPEGPVRFAVVKAMLTQFAALLQSLQARPRVSVINTQGTLRPVPASWHNELHPSKEGFKRFAGLFHDELKKLFPGRVAR